MIKTLIAERDKIVKEIEEKEEILSSDNWGTFEEFFEREYKEEEKLKPDMYRYGIAIILYEKEILKAILTQIQKDIELIKEDKQKDIKFLQELLNISEINDYDCMVLDDRIEDKITELKKELEMIK